MYLSGSYRIQWWAVVKTAMNCWVTFKVRTALLDEQMSESVDGARAASSKFRWHLLCPQPHMNQCRG
jgi:hypothetical protein